MEIPQRREKATIGQEQCKTICNNYNKNNKQQVQLYDNKYYITKDMDGKWQKETQLPRHPPSIPLTTIAEVSTNTATEMVTTAIIILAAILAITTTIIMIMIIALMMAFHTHRYKKGTTTTRVTGKRLNVIHFMAAENRKTKPPTWLQQKVSTKLAQREKISFDNLTPSPPLPRHQKRSPPWWISYFFAVKIFSKNQTNKNSLKSLRPMLIFFSLLAAATNAPLASQSVTHIHTHTEKTCGNMYFAALDVR